MACQELTKEIWTSVCQRKSTFLFDCDGVLWNGNNAIPGSIDAFNYVKRLGKKALLVTNNSSKSRKSYVEKCQRLGLLDVKLDDIISTSAVAADYLRNVAQFPTSGRRVYIVGSAGIADELAIVGIESLGVGVDRMEDYGETIFDLELQPNISAVVVGYDGEISYPKVTKAASYLKNPECLFIATNDDETLPSGNNRVVCPGAGSIVAFVATAARRSPVVLGKPHRPMWEYVYRKFQVKADEAIMVGDRLRTDIQFARRNGMSSFLVLTGDSDLQEVERAKSEDKNLVPDFYSQTLGDILRFV